MVVALVALFVALSGGAYATTQALITSDQIANKTIRVVDLHPSAVKALKGQRGPRGFAGATGAPGGNGAPGANGLPGPQGALGAQGPPGPQGPEGPQGTQGVQGLPGANGANGANGGFDPNKITLRTSGETPIPMGAGTTQLAVACGAGEIAVAGGYNITAGRALLDSPDVDKRGWIARIANPDQAAGTGYAIAVCARP
jgi:Collagen triple helix repeat (20 copies)